MFDLTDLRAFARIADLGSISATARALRSHPELVDDLQWHVAAEAAFLANLQIFDITTHKLLRELPKRGP